MKNTEARNILGLEPGDKPRAFLAEFEETREYKQELVNNAPSEPIRFRYQQELLEYEAAMKVAAGKKRIRPHTDFIVVLLLIASLSTVGWWGYQWYQQQWKSHSDTELQITGLHAVGRNAAIGRKWTEAEKAYQEIERLDPGSRTAAEGFESIKQGKLEEKNQQIFYTLGESQAALEAGRWDKAERLVSSVLVQSPENETAKRKLEIIHKGRRQQDIALKMTAVSEALDAADLITARQALGMLRMTDPRNPNIQVFASRIKTLEEAVRKRHEKATALYQQALALDTGEFSEEAMAMLDQARRLYPESAEIQEQYKKMGSYSRAIGVPGDYPSIAEAVEAARSGDTIRVSPGTYDVPVIISKPVRLEGSADGKTIMELPAKEAALITITAAASGTHLSGFDFRHLGFDHSAERYSGITIEAEKVTISSCNIEHSAGHGIAVMDGAQVKISGCKITHSGWDGISVYGKNSTAEITDTLCQANLQNGIGFWLGGSGSVTNSRLLKNGFCGITAMSKGAIVTLDTNTCSSNREAGILISDAVTANLTANVCEKNLLSGIVARSEGTTVSLIDNVTKGNYEAGILTHLGVNVGKFENNRSSGNLSQQIWRDADLKSDEGE